MKVGLFVTCLVDAMRPRIGFATLRLLEKAGCEVVVPETQTCCGQPASNEGDVKTARMLAKKLITEFEIFDYVVIPSGSCGGQIKVHYPELLDDEPDWKRRAEALAQRTFELTDFLVNVLKLESVPGKFNGTVTYHDACSGLRELNIKEQPRLLLDKVAGLKLKEMDASEECCGFGGAFSVEYGDISAQIVERKCNHICSSGADAVVLGDLGCMLNIEGRLKRRGDETIQVLHIAEVLAGEDEGGKS